MENSVTEILALLPKDEVEMAESTTPQFDTRSRRRLLIAHPLAERLWRSNPSEEIYEVLQLIPHSAPNLEAAIATAEGRTVIRGQIAEATRLLKIIESRNSTPGGEL